MPAALWAFFADSVLLLHAAFVLFVVLGQLLIMLGWWRGWGWTCRPPWRFLHLAAIAYVVLESWLGVVCPLTLLEYRLRVLAGQSVSDLGFIAYWVQRLLFYQAPEWVFTLIYSLFGGLVLLTWLAYPPRRERFPGVGARENP